MKILEHKPRPATGSRLRANDPALEEFRAIVGEWAIGKTDEQLAQVKLFADWLADTAIAQTSRRRRPGVASERT